MGESTLTELLSDISDTEVTKKEVVVRIKEQLSSLEYTIEDSTNHAVLVFQENSKKRTDGIVPGLVIRLFGIKKVSSCKFEYSKHSLWMEEKNHSLQNVSRKNLISLKDLSKFKAGDVVKETLIVKVTEVRETLKTKNGTPFKKVVIADENFSIRMTIWRNEILQFEKRIVLGGVYELSNFSMDKYPLNSDNEVPKDINLRYSSQIRMLDEHEIPKVLKDLPLEDKNASTEGTIKYITNIYEYVACPGNGGPCGKAVKENQMCEKCGINLSKVQTIQAYKCELVFFGKNDIIYHITAFSSQLKTFEKEGKTPEERLETIKNMQAFVKMYEKGDDYFLSKLTIPEYPGKKNTMS